MNEALSGPASESLVEIESSSAGKLRRLKTIVEHIGDQWVAVLHRQAYFHAMTRNPALAEALSGTYAAHVHNTITDIFVIDLIREIGALVLDRDSTSASVTVAVKLLRDPLVLDELRKEYHVVLPSQWLSGRDVPDEVRRGVDQQVQEKQVVENLQAFNQQVAQLAEVESLLTTKTSELLRTARNKSVAHYDVVRSGGDRKLWRIDEAGELTYGQLDEYVDACTSAVDGLLHLVKRVAHDFDGTRHVAQDYAADYIAALVIGLKRKKEHRDARIARLSDE
jgi:hypothetical protein